MNVKTCVDFSACCGCGACAAICPTNAIQMEYAEKDWHLHPQLNSEKCINCKKCVNVCPALNEKSEEKFEPYGYAATASDDIRKASSSGGMFWLMARYILEKGGYVAGAVYDENLVVKHTLTNKIEEAEKMRGSKYVQSNASEIYPEILELLKAKKKVLFTGTPCQVAAVKAFVGKYSDNLICVDILCHGVPSPKVFDLYLCENFNKEEIETVLFRNKEHRRGHPGSLTIVLKDGREFYSEYFDNSYYKYFLLSHRESCFDCKFAEFPRVGDISIGDFWGAKDTDTKIDYENGCSVIFINSKKGKALFGKIRPELDCLESYSNETLMSWNRNKRLLENNTKHCEIPSLIRKKNSVRAAVDMILDGKYDVGIFGVTMNPNFGGLITYWALYEAIEKLGYRTAIVARPVNSPDALNETHATEFFKKHCNITEQLSHEELYKLNEKIDKFVLGSDQVWNYNLFECWWDSLYFDFVNDEKIKIAYAASFGYSEHKLPIYKIGQVSKNFKRFDYIGVREKEGVDILKNNYFVDSEHVLDPVFLVDTEKYSELAALSDVDVSGKYVGSYVIEPNDFKLSAIKAIKEKLGIDNLNVTDGNPDLFSAKSQWYRDRDMHVKADATIYDWLKILKNCEFFVTDSFHAACFCIMFSKPFVLLQDSWALSRIESLLNTFSLENRWVKTSNIENFEINESWFLNLPNEIKDIFGEEKEKSYNWLKRALASPKTISERSGYRPLLDKERVEDYFYFLMQKRSDYVVVVSSCNLDRETLSKVDFKCRLSFEKFEINGPAFVMIYDFENDLLSYKSHDFAELKYDVPGKTLICLADRKVEPFANNLYVFGKEREYTSLNSNAGLNISIYSKSQGHIIDNFEVEIKDETAYIKR